MERKKILLLFLTLIFILSWGWQLILKKKRDKKMTEPLVEEKEIIWGIDLRKIEENFSEVKKKMDEFENNINFKRGKITISKNPLRPYLIKKQPEKIIKEEEKKQPEKPNFKILGIVYDNKKPYVVINDEVKEEGEMIGNFVLQKIYPDKIVVKDKDENFFTLNFEFEKGEKNER
ncbi:MAG: hypothetical protein NC833_06065 [Candidatus Omnitrophica bacterium]|nr:hypothetical protein [Candidatus Omnitrophota bacterium]